MMKFKSQTYQILFFVLMLTMVLSSACRKDFDDKDAYAVFDKISLSYGNDRIFNSFDIKNSGNKTLTYHVDEQIDWLEISNPDGSVDGLSLQKITCKVSRLDLPQENYSGKLYITSNGGDHVIDVYMTVNMSLVTFINPAFSNITLEVDTIEFSNEPPLYTMLIGENDSLQFGFFSMPQLVSYYGTTSGYYTDSTQLGLQMQWEGTSFLNEDSIPRFIMDVSKAYFHLSITNNQQVLNPLYVNAGTQYEMIENIFVYQSSDPLPIGYYHAQNHTVIRAWVVGSTSAVTWTNGAQFTLPFTVNQSITVDNFNSDTIKKKSTKIHPSLLNGIPVINREYGDVTEIFAIGK